MSADIAELDAALADIDAGAFLWDQGSWIDPPTDEADLTQPGAPPCETAMCLAGHVAWKHGWRPDPDGGEAGELEYWGRLDDTDRTEFVGDIAREILGLTRQEANALFHYRNDRQRLQEIRDALAAGEPVEDPVDWVSLP